MKNKKKVRSAYHRISSGQILARFQHRKIRFFTLTSSDDSRYNDFSRDIDVLVKTIRRKQPNFQYCKINVFEEGRWHTHVLYKGKYIPQKWLSCKWNQIHKSPIVDIRSCDNDRSIASYLINQYLSNQNATYTRISYSTKWLYKGAIRDWRDILSRMRKRCFFNPVQCQWYYKRKKIEFKQILRWALDLWERVLYQQSYTQTLLSDYG